MSSPVFEAKISHTPFALQLEMLTAANVCLTPPYLEDEAHSIAKAFHYCSRAFNNCPQEALPETVHTHVRRTQELMDTDAVVPSLCREGEGLWVSKARMLTSDEKLSLVHGVQELTLWFER